MSTEALVADFLLGIAAALTRLAEGLDGRPLATVTPIAPGSFTGSCPGEVEPVGAPAASVGSARDHTASDAAGATGPDTTTPQVSGPVDLLQCPDCTRRFANLTALGIHRRRSHGVVGKVKKRKDVDSRREPTPCPKGCGRVFTWTPALGSHAKHCDGNGEVRPKNPPLPLRCPQCGLVARNGAGAFAHARVCGTTAPTKRAARLRAQRRGEPGLPVDCPHCGRTFRSPAGAANHIKACAPRPPLDAIPVDVPPAPEFLVSIVHAEPDDPETDEAMHVAAIDDDLATLGVITDEFEFDEVAGGFDDEPDPSSDVEDPVLPTSEELDPLDPGRVRYRCPDCGAERDELIDARFHQRLHRHGQPVKFTAPTRSRA